MSERYVNQLNKNETKNRLCIRKEEKVVNRVKRVCVVFRHNDCEGTGLYNCLRLCKVNEEGAESGIFEEEETSAVPPTDIPVTG